MIQTKRDKFKKYFSNNDFKKLLELFDSYGDIIKGISNISACRDIKDNFLLSLSIDSKADYLITGDNDLLEIKTIGKTKIITISEFELRT